MTETAAGLISKVMFLRSKTKGGSLNCNEIAGMNSEVFEVFEIYR
jgi:hypothetical protein